MRKTITGKQAFPSPVGQDQDHDLAPTSRSAFNLAREVREQLGKVEQTLAGIRERLAGPRPEDGDKEPNPVTLEGLLWSIQSAGERVLRLANEVSEHVGE